MPREDGLPLSQRSGEAGPARPTTPSLALLEQLVALADRAIEAARGGDLDTVNALLDEREPFLAQLAATLGGPPAPLPAGTGAPSDSSALPSPRPTEEPAEQLAALARRDLDAMLLLERGIAQARIQMAGELDAVAAAQATVSRYAGDAPLAPPPATIDIRR